MKQNVTDTPEQLKRVLYSTSGFSISGIAASDEEHVSPRTGLWYTSLPEAAIAHRCAPEHRHPLPRSSAEPTSRSHLSSPSWPLHSGRDSPAIDSCSPLPFPVCPLISEGHSAARNSPLYLPQSPWLSSENLLDVHLGF